MRVVEVRVDVLHLTGQTLVHGVEVGREPAVGLVHVLAEVLGDLDGLVGGARNAVRDRLGSIEGLGDAVVVLPPLLLEEGIHRVRHGGVVRRAQRFECAVAAHGHERALLGLDVTEPEARHIHGAQHVRRDEPGVGPAAEAHGLHGDVHVLAHERLLHDLHAQHALLDVHQAHAAGGVEAALVDPLLQSGRLVAVALVHQREAVALREVDEQQVHVLEGHVADGQEQRRARLVRVPQVEGEEARQRGGQLRPAVLQRALSAAGHLHQHLGLLLNGLAGHGLELTGLGLHVPHVEEVEPVVVGVEQLGAVVRARRRPRPRGPLHQRVGPHAGVDVGQVEPGEAGAGHEQEGFLQLRQGNGLVGALIGEHALGNLHPQGHSATLPVEEGLVVRIREGIREAGRLRAHGGRE